MGRRDRETLIGHTRIQHGKMNDRIYVMDYKPDLDPYFINQVQLMAKEYDYGKIIAKIPADDKEIFAKNQFKEEAFIPDFYKGKKDCVFMAKYYKNERLHVDNKRPIISNLNQLEEHGSRKLNDLRREYQIRELHIEDVDDMVLIFLEVFKTYPFPIHDPSFIKKTMNEGTIYFGVFYEGDLVGISSGEMDVENKNVEMTDFAIIPSHRGNGLAKHLLKNMEVKMKELGIKTAYTIARSISYPMNATFSGRNYKFSGTLWNNTHIAGKIESMNVWYKKLASK